ncbi:MAG TPA: sulfotransferase domain-containing protein [Ktedonobacteraceae bacterium]|nr:sulfotransferase domain-containing protein [Ktedonobacteraceae bacterium]
MVEIDRILRKAYRATTNWVRMMPDFIIIGTQKGGTTSLYHYLIEHPSIAPVYVKEPHFFDIFFSNGVPWYRAQFPSVVQKYYMQRVKQQPFITGEASPYYLFHPLVPRRIAAILPRTRFIVLLRNPVDRAYSQYQHQLRQPDVEPLSFEEALDREQERIAGEEEKLRRDGKYVSFNHRHYSYASRGIYMNQLPVWMKTFPRERFLIMRSEDLFANPKSIINQTLEFLNIPISDEQSKKEYKPFNDGGKYEPMKPETRARLVEYFKPHNARLYEFLDRDFGWDC